MRPQFVLLLVAIYISLFCNKLHAESRALSSELKTKLQTSSLSAEAEFSYQSFINADAPYFGAEENAAGLTSLGLGIHSGKSRMNVDGHWFFVPQEDFHYVNLPELSYEVQSAQSKFYVGRHLYAWSQADEFWEGGIWQPRFMWDYLAPEQNGLTGVFYSAPLNEDTAFTLFVSGIFLPDLGPQYREQDGQVIAKNPWLKTPPRVANLFDVDTPISASVDEPDARDILLKPSLALQLQKIWGDNLSSLCSYAYKPVNILRMTYEYYLQASTKEAVVIAHPRFPYEQVFTAETTYSRGGLAITPSLTHQEPIPDRVPFKNISQGMEPTTTGSLTIRKDLDSQSSAQGNFYFGVIKTWAPTPKDYGNNIPDESIFYRRQQFYLAYRAGVEAPIYRHHGRPVLASVEGTYDSEQEGGIFKTEVAYSVIKNLNLSFELSILGATSSRKTEYETGMLRSFRANDNASLGMNYVF